MKILSNMVLSGDLTATTPASNDNSTKVATTAFVKAQGYLNSLPTHTHAWGDISGKPTTFAPSAHTHAISEVTGLQTALDGKQAAGSYAAASHSHAFADLTAKPTTLAGYGITDAALSTHNHSGVYAPVSHTHTIANVTGLQTALDGKQAAGSYAAASHTHTISNITGLQTALDGKQPVGSYLTAVPAEYLTQAQGDSLYQPVGSYASATHTHTIGDVTGLQTALDGKQVAGSYAAASHTHTFASLTSKPTTLAGYGITDAATSTQGGRADTAYGWGNHASAGYATQTYVNTAVSNLVDAAPATLDTLNELAAALGDDPNFATTMTNALAGKASTSHTHTFASLTSKPTTLSGYGITDAASSSHTHTFASLTSKPTTLSGYGITDAASSTHNHDGVYSSVSHNHDSSYLPMSYGDVDMENYDKDKNLLMGRNIGGFPAGVTKPSGSHNGFGIFQVTTHSSGYATQLGLDTNQNALWIRSANPTTWGTWKRLWDTDNLTTSSISNWNTAFGWGNHASQGYLTAIPAEYLTQAQGDSLYQPVGSYAAASHSHTFASLTSKPTTLSGYGITDAASSSHTHTFASLTSKPTTLAGYGITDAAASSHTHTIANVTGLQTALDGKQAAGSYLTSLGFSYGTGVSANYMVQRDVNGYIYANYVNHSSSETENPSVNSFFVSNGDGWTRKASVAHIASTLGLGSAAYTASTDYAAASHSHTFASLTSKPTTLVGYGITDAATSGQGSKADTAYGWGNHASAGYLTSVTNISGYSNTLLREDNRTISPSELSAGQMKFGFTSWANNNTAPYADFIHLRSYTDSSGGSDNLVMFKKSGIGMRIWQQTWGSATAYSSYVDVWTTADFSSSNVTNWNSAYSWGNHASAGYLTAVPAEYLTQAQADSLYQPAGSYAASSHTHTFASLTSKPTTLSGYGITDAASSSHTHTFASLTSKPTTLVGYGITDAATSGQGTKADTAYGWGNHASAGYLTSVPAQTWASITGKPTTFTPSSHTHSFTDLTDSYRMWNNSGENHSTRTAFDAQGANSSVNFGWRYVQGNTNAPNVGNTGNGQYYSLYVGLGNDYAYNQYGMQIAIPRTSTNPYLSLRFLEGSAFGAWQKISAAYADSAGAVAWGNVSGKPSTFAPSAHTHAISDVTGLQTALDGKQAAGSYAAASHTHTIANVTGLQTALDGKQAAGSYAAASHTHAWSEITGKPTTFAPSAHTHAISEVTGLQTALDGKASSSHTHSYLPLSGGTLSGSLSVTGNITATGDVTAYSDERLKTDIEVIENPLDKVLGMRGVTFRKNDEEARSVGVIAQEVLAVLPEAVHQNEDGLYSVAYGNLVGLLIEAIKEQQIQINELSAKLNGL